MHLQIVLYLFLLLLLSISLPFIHLPPYLLRLLTTAFFCVNIYFLCITALYYKPGDFQVYTHYFESCISSPSLCASTNIYEPLFYILVFVSSRLLSHSWHVWVFVVFLTQLFFYLSLSNLRGIYFSSKQLTLCLYLFTFTYTFTNLSLLAVRSGLASSIFLYGFSYFLTIRPYSRIIGFLICLSSVFIHYQVIFFFPLFIFLLLSKDHNLRFLVSLLQAKIPLYISARSIYILLFMPILFLLLLPFSSSLLITLGKSYYLSNYQSSSYGIRPFLEFFISLSFILPFFKYPTFHSSKSNYYTVIFPVAISSTCLLLFSLLIYFLSLKLFSIDGFARQVQLAFLFSWITFTSTRTSSSTPRINWTTILVYAYTISMVIYTLNSDPSFSHAPIYS
jgi:hypothetical protein